jgi:hypothetical protein
MAVMWASTCASSVVTRLENTYHATAIAISTKTKAPFAKGLRSRSHWLQETNFGSAAAATCCWESAPAATGGDGAAGGVGPGGEEDDELIIRFTFQCAFYFLNISLRIHSFDFAGRARKRRTRQVELKEGANLVVAGARQSILGGGHFDVRGHSGRKPPLRLGDLILS